MTAKQDILPFSAKVLGFCFALTCATGVGEVRAQAFETQAPYVYVMDAQTGSVLLDNKGSEQMAPSSMSKLMTAYLVFERLQDKSLSLSDKFLVSQNAQTKGGKASGGSTMFLNAGSQVTIDDLLRGIIVQSGNDACITVAENISGSEAAFAVEMNRKAKELGLTNSNFTNATGLPDPNHYSTPRDLAILAHAIINRFPEYYGYYSLKEFTYNKVTQENRNPLLSKGIGVDGLKTGHTSAAGYGLTASAKQGDRRVILVINGLGSMRERSDESLRLMNWALRNFENVSLFEAGAKVSEAEVWAGSKSTVSLVLDKPAFVTVPRNAGKEMQIKVVYSSPLKAPIQKGTAVATLILHHPDMAPLSLPLVAGETVEKLGWGGRYFNTLGQVFSQSIDSVVSFVR